MIETKKQELKRPRTYIVWKCEVIDGDQNPGGKGMPPACGRWFVKSTAVPESKGLMAHCKGGFKGNGGAPRRVRLNKRTRKFHLCPTREEAERLANALNEMEGLN